MKLVTFTAGDLRSFGIWTNRGVIDIGRRLDGWYEDLHQLFANGSFDETIHIPRGVADFAHADVRLDKPLLRWGKCFCVGVNYPERNAEYKDGSAAPQYPSLFVRFPESLVRPDAPLVRPPESAQLDYEGEVVLVIGKAGRRIPQARWADHVAAYTIGNEGSIRDWIRHGKFNVTPGKNWAGSGALGPWLVTPDEIADGPLRIITRVNGEVRQDDTTDRMTFSFGRIIEYISTFCTLEPGDVIFTGTPAGSGARLDPPKYLVPGDVVEIEVPGIGVLRNTVEDERH